MSKLKHIINKFPKSRILVIGDLMLDEFIWGTVSRISPEAPVPVVWVKSESFMPGGAANVANNIRGLGGGVDVCGIIGDDEKGRLLKNELQGKGIGVEGVIVERKRPTIMKSRVIAHNQQVVRIDREDVGHIEDNLIDRILTYAREVISEIDGLIIEDYGKGLIVPRLIKELVVIARSHKKIITVDPKERHFSYYTGVTAITPNHYEAQGAVGKRVDGVDGIEDIGKELLEKLETEGVLITLGEDGMCLIEKGARVTRISTTAQEVFDVSGAGDTVIAVFTQALICGASMKEAAHIANIAAGIVVGKVGVAVVTKDELIRAVS